MIYWKGITAVWLCAFFLGMCLAFVPLTVQSQEPSPIPTIDPSSLPKLPQMAGSIVRGFVLDEAGNPVPDAVVTLWQDGKIWQHGKMIVTKADNPQMSHIFNDEPYPQEYSLTGLFWYGLVGPGQYVLTAEKDGYKGSAAVTVGNDMINNAFGGSFYAVKVMANVTLDGYHVPVLIPEQLSYTGAISGTIVGKYGVRMSGANVSLWRDGQIVKMPKNPQANHIRNVSGREVDYVFEHLAPGRYQVMVEYAAPHVQNESVSVDVGDNATTADIVLMELYLSPPTIIPTPSASPDPVSGPSTSPAPAPSPGIFALALSTGMAVILVYCRRKRQ